MNKDLDEQIDHLFKRFVGQDIDGDHLREVLKDKKKRKNLRVKLGIDPTASELHVGHLVPVRLLQRFQELGCTAVLIIGDYTARIGDPSGRDVTRPPLDANDVKKNATTYLKQLESVLDVESTEIRWQSEWYDAFQLGDVIRLLASASVSQIIEHNTFKERLANNSAFFMHEALYPLLQAYDSVAVEADVELGALDQLFNIGMGRTVQKAYEQEPQAVLVTPYILGTDGRKMSKSFDNTINLTDAPEKVFGKVMSISDDLIESYARLLTNLDYKKLSNEASRKGEEARNAKRELASSVVSLLFDDTIAAKARASFEQTFSKETIAEELIEDIVPESNPIKATSLVLNSGWTESKSEAKRVIEERGVTLIREGIVVWASEKWGDLVEWKEDDVLQIGKTNFYRLKPT